MRHDFKDGYHPDIGKKIVEAAANKRRAILKRDAATTREERERYQKEAYAADVKLKEATKEMGRRRQAMALFGQVIENATKGRE